MTGIAARPPASLRRSALGLAAACALFALACTSAHDAPPSSATPRDQAPPLRIFLRGGEKTHGPGQHDHPRFVAEWEPLLEARGAAVESALVFPTREQLERTDVLVMYAAEGGSIHGDERANLEAFLARGGGLVVLHDAICGDDPHWFKTVVGGAWEHGHAKWHEGKVGIYFEHAGDEITRGAENFDLDDEIYTELHLEPDIRVLARAFPDVFEAPPQMWTYEKASYRAFVSIQGHQYASFAHPAWRTLVLRGIAWAGRREVDLLTDPNERATLRYPPGGPTRPEDSAASLRVAPEFELSLVAAEPLIEKPISLEWDAAGRLWVAQTPGYPEKARFSGVPAHDRIDVLEDRDGDGRMEHARTFADGLDLVTSFVFHQRGVIASAAPDILSLQDTDGDGRADVREVLYGGFGFGDTHAVVSNLRWGLDGWIYATQGYSGSASKDVVHEAPSGTVHFGKIGNGLFRFRPDGSAIEMVSSYGSNTWGCDFASDGELFFTMANGEHAKHVVVPERAFAGGRLPGVETCAAIADHERVFPLFTDERATYAQIDFVGGFTAASGCTLYEGGAWPERFRGSHFVCEPTVHIVHEDNLSPRGATFGASKPREEEFLASTDPWFRPVHTRVGPDGALYVLDFYNQAVVHNDTRGPQHGPTNAAARPDRDHSHGRIWRVQHREARASKQTSLEGAKTSELVRALEHENMGVRLTAQRLLVERNAREAAPQLAELARAGAEPFARIHALWTLAELGALDKADIAAALSGSDAGVRKNAARIAAQLGRADEVGRELVARLRDDDARVRIEALAAVATGSLGGGVAQELCDAFVRAVDDWSRSLVLSASARQPVEFLRAALASSDGTALASVDGTARATLVEEIAGVVGRSGKVEQAARAVEAIASSPNPPSTAARALERLNRDLRATNERTLAPATAAALGRLLRHDDLTLAAAALPFAVRWDGGGALTADVEALAERLSLRALDPEAEPQQRLACVRALLSIAQRRGAAVAAAEALLDPLQPPEVQLAVLDELARIDDEQTSSALVRAFPTLGNAGRERAFQRILERPARVRLLVDALAANAFAPNDLGPHKVAQLRNYAEASTAKRANEVLDTLVGSSTRDLDALIAKLAPIVEQPGDTARGRELFKTNCATCHTLEGAGGNVGPKLDGIGAHGAHALLPVILDPNRTVEAAFVEYVAETTDERRFAGVLAREGADAIVLRSSSGDVEIPRGELASLRSTGRSPMPVGLEALGADGLRDLLAYLTAGYEGFRTLDLRPYFVASTRAGLYDTRHDANPMEFVRTGVIRVEGVPFDLVDPALASGGKNALALKGGRAAEWQCKRDYPRRVEIPLGYAPSRVHVLGGIAAWGFPCSRDSRPIARWIWRYASGAEQEVVLRDGVEFADWIGRRDVPGSRWVEGLVKEDSAGQVRTFSLAPERAERVASIVLESYDNDMSPTFLALTCEVGEGARGIDSGTAVADGERAPAADSNSADMILVGGGSSHDFARWFGGSDRELLGCEYTEDVAALAPRLASTRVLVLSNNQPFPADARAAIDAFVARGGGLVCVHAACWFNWADWPVHNASHVGGGARSHEELREFEVRVVDGAHPLARGVPETFRITDELYRFERTPQDAEIHVIAVGRSLSTQAEYPVVWTVARQGGRTACITLGHDGAAHEHAAYRALLANAARWTAER